MIAKAVGDRLGVARGRDDRVALCEGAIGDQSAEAAPGTSDEPDFHVDDP
jgi:hypothetical protein